MYVFVDRNRFAQILVNVLNNASKYSPDGGRIDISAYDDRQTVHIDIVDNGSGITADLMPNVFDLFSQGTRTLDRSEGGLGIGLSIVKRLVDMQDGDIQIRSAGANQGTTVAMQFPRMTFGGSLAADEHSNAHQLAHGTRHVHRPPQARHLRILVVDDNKDAADSLALLCQTDEHIACTAYNAYEALAVSPQFAPDVALLDIGLPEMNGYELAARLRECCPQPPLLIAVTGYGQDEDRQRSRKAGFAHHFVKPIDVHRLLHLLATL
jgi:CheY-like chemotaxis protein/anti-sigma regulatory factor (Ser/Thr protein kinase)